MPDNTSIEWTHRPGTIGETWNPIVGCSLASPGCTNCYAMGTARRQVAMQAALGRSSHYEGTVTTVKGKPIWTGVVRAAPDAVWEKPLRWTKPRTIFVNSMGDVFHEAVPDEWIDRLFAIMALCPQHTFIVLTKRSARMREYSDRSCGRIADTIMTIRKARGDKDMVLIPLLHIRPGRAWWPLPNVWLGVSAEDQRRADERVPDLLATPAAIRFVSAEPLLGPIDFSRYMWPVHGWWKGPYPNYAEAKAAGVECGLKRQALVGAWCTFLDQIIVGGESGNGARPMHPDWARQIRDQCAAAGTAFFFKQFGEFRPLTAAEHGQACGATLIGNDPYDRDAYVLHVGKHRAGRMLDGVEHSAFPAVRQ